MKGVFLLLLSVCCLLAQAQDPVEQKLREREARIQRALEDRASRIQWRDSAQRQRIWQRIRLLQMPDAPGYQPEKQSQDLPTAAPEPPFRAENIEKEETQNELLPFLKEVSPQPVSAEGRRMQWQFFGRKLQLSIDPAFAINLNTSSAQAMQQAWDSLARCDYPSLLGQLKQIREDLLLNDWGYLQLAHQLAKNCLPPNSSELSHTVFTAFLLEYSGYEIGLAQQEGHRKLHLVMASADTLYRLAYLAPDQLPAGRTLDDIYYVINPENGKLFTQIDEQAVWSFWGPQDDKKGKSMDMTILYAPLLDEENWQGHEPGFVQKSFSFAYKGKQQQLSWRLSRNLLAFYDAYPVTSLKHIFFVSLGQSTLHFKTPDHPANLLGHYADEGEQLAILLAFCQSLPRLEDQGEMEEYYFPEQSLYYGFSDCDDRAVLYAALVRCYLGYEVKLALWESPRARHAHVATCLKLPGDTWMYCDPTHLEAHTEGGLPPGELLAPYCEVLPRCFRHAVNSCMR